MLDFVPFNMSKTCCYSLFCPRNSVSLTGEQWRSKGETTDLTVEGGTAGVRRVCSSGSGPKGGNTRVQTHVPDTHADAHHTTHFGKSLF